MYILYAAAIAGHLASSYQANRIWFNFTVYVSMNKKLVIPVPYNIVIVTSLTVEGVNLVSRAAPWIE